MHPEAAAFLASHATPAVKTVLDVGGRNINGSPRGLFADASYTVVDLTDGPGVDVVADIVYWDDRRKFDVVICAEVLEHVEEWRPIVTACWERVRVGGVLLVTCATDPRAPHSVVDGIPELRRGEHYANIDPEDLAEALRAAGCENASVEAHRDRGDLYAVATRKGRKRG